MFTLSDEQWVKLHVWQKEVTKRNAEKQRKIPAMAQHMLDEDTPYTGAIGGSLTYSFTPTSLGLIVKVTDGLSNETIDLTEYSEW